MTFMQCTWLAQSIHKHTLCVGECPQYPSNGLHNCSDVLQLIPAYHHEPHFIAGHTSKKIKCSLIRLIPHPEQICVLPLLLRYCCVFQTPCPRRSIWRPYISSVFSYFSPFLFGSGLAFDFFLHHKMCPSGQQKLEQCNTVIHAFRLIIIIDVWQIELPIL